MFCVFYCKYICQTSFKILRIWLFCWLSTDGFYSTIQNTSHFLKIKRFDWCTNWEICCSSYLKKIVYKNQIELWKQGTENKINIKQVVRILVEAYFKKHLTDPRFFLIITRFILTCARPCARAEAFKLFTCMRINWVQLKCREESSGWLHVVF